MRVEAPLPVPRTRVLVVDDSVVARRVVARALEGEDSLEVVGAAADGRLAIEKVERLRPDVVVLDLEMPEMDGFAVLAEIRRRARDVRVIVFSHLTRAGAAATLEAMALGATSFAVKPSAGDVNLAVEHVRAELLPQILALAPPSPPLAASAPPLQRRPAAAGRVSAVVVAVSTGGPTALATLVAGLPPDLGAPVLIVQHMPPVFTAMLAERLDRIGALPAREAAHGDTVTPGGIWLAPGGRHLGVARVGATVRVVLSDDPPENCCRPAADVLFRTAAEVYGAGVLALVLTGMGQDGLRGAEAVRAAGGSVVAQSQETCVVGGMPRAVVAAGLADAVVPLDALAAEVARRAPASG